VEIDKKRLALGLFLGPLIASEYMAVLHYIVGRWEDFELGMLLYSPFLALTYYMFMLPIAGVFGVPAYFVFRRFGLLNGVVISSFGLLVGFLVAGVTTGGGLGAYAVLGSGGFLSAALAWWFMKPRSNQSLKSGTPQSGAP